MKSIKMKDFKYFKSKDSNFTHGVDLEYALASLWCNITYGYGSYCYNMVHIVTPRFFKSNSCDHIYHFALFIESKNTFTRKFN